MEAAVLEAKNAAASGPSDNAVFLPEGQEFNSPLRHASADALPDNNTTCGFNRNADRVWISIVTAEGTADPALTREVLATVLLASPNRP
jgi:hypothetical protein